MGESSLSSILFYTTISSAQLRFHFTLLKMNAFHYYVLFNLTFCILTHFAQDRSQAYLNNVMHTIWVHCVYSQCPQRKGYGIQDIPFRGEKKRKKAKEMKGSSVMNGKRCCSAFSLLPYCDICNCSVWMSNEDLIAFAQLHCKLLLLTPVNLRTVRGFWFWAWVHFNCPLYLRFSRVTLRKETLPGISSMLWLQFFSTNHFLRLLCS